MKNLNEMSKTELKQEIILAEHFVNNGGRLTQEEWNRVFKMMQLVRED